MRDFVLGKYEFKECCGRAVSVSGTIKCLYNEQTKQFRYYLDVNKHFVQLFLKTRRCCQKLTIEITL